MNDPTEIFYRDKIFSRQIMKDNNELLILELNYLIL